MRQRQPGDRLRVVIAGTIYAKRALVRRFLEDDGFDVVGEALTREELLAIEDLGRADALVLDADLLDDSIDRLRTRAPDAVVVVFTDQTARGVSKPAGADGYLEKGVGLASLTVLLHSLLSEPPALPLARTEAAHAPRPERRVLTGFAGIVASTVLVTVIALAAFGAAGPSPTSEQRVAAPTPGPTESPSPSGPDAREMALGDLHDLRSALAAGRPIEAAWILDMLQRDLLAAREAGFSVSGIGTLAARLLHPFLGDLAPDVLGDLRSLFGSVFGLPTGTTVSGAASTTGALTGSISKTTSGGTTSGGIPSSGAGGAISGGAGTGGDGGTGAGGGGTGGGNEGTDAGGEGGATPPASHGQGHHYGWRNKPPKGGWRGTKPHPQGHAYGHGRGHGRGENDD